ncbi:hypothetical protein [Gymnodinialimonas ulvae]|uniref:hypothetical protein n=1 Tax=Gymnodinialimonas ulvae TaxID=3126504 RepID=UPI0030A631A6
MVKTLPPIDTSQDYVIFPHPITIGMLLGILAVGSLGVLVIPMALRDGDWSMVWLGGGWSAFCLLILVLLLRKRAAGHPEPTLVLSSEGLRLLQSPAGVIPWTAIRSVGTVRYRYLQGASVTIDKAALDALDQGPAFKAARTFDAAIGVHVLIFPKQKLEIPVPDFIDLLHSYSIAYGGPPLRRAP